MNDPIEPTEPNGTERRLADELRSAAHDIEVADARTSLPVVEQTARRRTNRRRGVIGGVCAVALVGGIGAVVVNDGDNDGDLIRSAEPEAAAVESDEATSPSPTTTQPPPPPAAAASDVATAFNAIPVGDHVQWLVPWGDGFLAGGWNFPEPPPMSDLPDDIVALFPDEVLALFPGGLPDSIDIFFETIYEAGLDEEQIWMAISEHPEAEQAIFGAPGEPSLEFAVSADGIEWEPVALSLPDGITDILQFTAVGDRLVVVGQEWPEYDEPAVLDDEPPAFVPPPPAPREFVIASTTDLSTWTTQALPLDVRDDLPDTVWVHSWPRSIAIQDDRWMVALEVSYDIQPESLLTGDDLELLYNGGYGMSYDENGVTFEFGGHFSEPAMEFDENGEPIEPPPPATIADGEAREISFTWDELGIPADLFNSEYGGPSPQTALWTATWDGEPTTVAGPPTEMPWFQIASLGDGFAAFGDGSGYAFDGAAWSPIDAPAETWINSSMPVDGGTVLFASGPGGSQVYFVDAATLAWSPIDIPGAPDDFYPINGEGTAPGAVVIETTHDYPSPELDIRVELDGFTLVLQQRDGSESYELTDTATGEVIITESYRWDDPDIGEDGPWEYWTYDDDGASFLSPDDGSVLATVSFDELDRAYSEAYDDVAPYEEEYMPELAVIATTDGRNWLVESLPSDGRWFHAAAVNGNTVLVGGEGEWLRFEMPAG